MPFGEGRVVATPRTNSPAIWAVAIAIVLLVATMAVLGVALAQPRPVVTDPGTQLHLNALHRELELLGGRLSTLEEKVAKLSHGLGRGSNVGSERGAAPDSS